MFLCLFLFHESSYYLFYLQARRRSKPEVKLLSLIGPLINTKTNLQVRIILLTVTTAVILTLCTCTLQHCSYTVLRKKYSNCFRQILVEALREFAIHVVQLKTAQSSTILPWKLPCQYFCHQDVQLKPWF